MPLKQTSINLSKALSSVLSFSKQRVHSHDLINIIRSVMQQYFASSNQPSSTPPSLTSPAPQEAQKQKDKQLLQQITVKNTTEKQEQQPLYQAKSITKHGSSMPNSKSTLFIIPRLCTVRSSEDNALSFACQHITLFADETLLLNTQLGYVKDSKGIAKLG